MTRAQIVKKILTEVVGGIDIEDEQVRLHAENEFLRFLQTVREFDQRVRRGLLARPT